MATLNTIKLKRTPAAESLQSTEAPAAPVESPVAATTESENLGSISSDVPRVSGKAYKAFAIMGIVAVLFCLAVIGMQYTEWSFYKSNPTIWPLQ